MIEFKLCASEEAQEDRHLCPHAEDGCEAVASRENAVHVHNGLVVSFRATSKASFQGKNFSCKDRVALAELAHLPVKLGLWI